jgi:LPXTG-motif cell wall-anchored protein
MEQRLSGLSGRMMAVLVTVALAASMALGAAPAFALNNGGLTDDGTASITVHKYRTPAASSEPGTGSASDAGNLPTGAEPMKDVDFTLYKLDSAKVEGSVAGTAAVSTAPTLDGVTAFLNLYKANSFTPVVKTTDVDGTATFGSLSFGYYLLVETDAGGANVDVSVPSIITLPYAQQATGGATTYLKDVNVYPKNVSKEEVEKTIIDEPDLVKPGDTLSYQIAFKIPSPSNIFTDPANCLKGTIVDTLPKNGAGQPTITIKNDYTVVALAQDGTENVLTPGDIGFSDTSTTNGQATWTITPAIAQAINVINVANTATPAKQIGKVLIRVNATVNNNAFNAGVDANGLPIVQNTATVTIIDALGNTTIDTKTSVTNPIPLIGFQLVKVDVDGHAILTDSATFKLATSYDNAVAGTFLKNATATADLTATTNVADGKAVFSGLSFDNLTSGGTAYTAIEQAVTAARSSLGTVQTVELWMCETKAPNGYRILQAPQKVTLQIVKATADAKVTTSVVGGPLSLINTRDGQEGGGNFALPNTGGTGALIFGIVGAVLIGAAVTYFVRSRKRDQNKQS